MTVDALSACDLETGDDPVSFLQALDSSSKIVDNTAEFVTEDVSFLKFNDDAIKTMGLSSLLPSFLQWLVSFDINKDFKILHKALLPVITKRRQTLSQADPSKPAFLDFIMEAVEDDGRCTGKYFCS